MARAPAERRDRRHELLAELQQHLSDDDFRREVGKLVVRYAKGRSTGRPMGVARRNQRDLYRKLVAHCREQRSSIAGTVVTSPSGRTFTARRRDAPTIASVRTAFAESFDISEDTLKDWETVGK